MPLSGNGRDRARGLCGDPDRRHLRWWRAACPWVPPAATRVVPSQRNKLPSKLYMTVRAAGPIALQNGDVNDE